MKRLLILLSTIALFLLAGCERESIMNNPNYDPETNSVLTNFVFNISTASAEKTRQNADATQATASSSFRGVTDAILLTYKQGTNNVILSADATADKKYDLAEVASAGTLSSTDSRRVLEMSLPLQTNTLLFYGRAPQGTTAYDGYSLKECFGYLDTYQVDETAGSALFSLGKQLQDADKTKFYTTEKLLAGILSVIMNTNLAGANHVAISGTDAPTGVSTKYKFDVATTDYGEISWSSYDLAGNSPVESTHALYPAEEKLARAYKQMTTINSAGGELRAASGQALVRTITDLWTIVNQVRCLDPLNKPEAVAKYMANQIDAKIEKFFAATGKPADGAAITGVSFESMSDITANFNAETDRPNVSGQDYSTVWPSAADLTEIASTTPIDFPFNYGLPRGATHVAFDAARKVFYYPTTFNTSGMGGVMEGGSFNAESYFYPAELLYFGNSPIRTSDTDHKVSDYPSGATAWEAAASWTSDWDGAAVKASTRSVAMKHDINYGTALMATQVKYGAATLKDNNRAVQAEFQGVDLSVPAQAAAFSEQDKEIAVSGTSFLFTGIIIGGQSRNVGWDFLPLATGSTPAYTYGFVYDRAVPTAAKSIPAYTAAGSPSVPNYTMVFDNFKASSQSGGIYTADTQDKVYVALEFQNNSGQDFYGNHNLISDGGYFYLIAELDPTTATAPTWPTNYVLPPYKADGTSNQVTRVFMQDYLTSATFSLGENSLKHAYLTVPDLRSGSMTLGLSVDINWSPGLVFDDVVLGGN